MDDQLAPSMTISAQMADAGFRDALRLFQHDAAALREIGPSLETTVTPPEPPRVVSSDVIESTTVRSHRIADPPTPGFDAFLDKHAADGWKSLEDFRGIRRDRMVLQSQIRRPAGDEYQGGYEVVEGYAAPSGV